VIYADTDFFLALMKESDWLKEPAERLLRQYSGRIHLLPTVLIEILLLARREMIDPERLLSDVLQIGVVEGCDAAVFLKAAKYMKEHNANALDSLHAALCSSVDSIISSDKVFDRLGLKRIRLEQKDDSVPADIPK